MRQSGVYRDMFSRQHTLAMRFRYALDPAYYALDRQIEAIIENSKLVQEIVR